MATCDPAARATVGVPEIPTVPVTSVVPCAAVGTGRLVVFVTRTGVTGGVGAAVTVVRPDANRSDAIRPTGTRIEGRSRR